MVEQLAGTFVGRWYVTIFEMVFLVLAVRHLGGKRTAIYAAFALAVGAVAENGSVLFGFPYTSYAFNPKLRGHELWVGNVPLIVPMSYACLTYFAFAAGRLIVSGPHSSRGRQPVVEYLLAVVLATWALWVVDPVIRLGRYHMIGELFQYSGSGFWFGLPLGSQVGFFCTAGILIAVLTFLTRGELARPVTRLVRHPRLFASLTYLGEVVFIVGAAIFVSCTAADDQVAAEANSLAGAFFIVAIPMILLTVLYWKSLPQAHGTGAPSRVHAVDPATGEGIVPPAPGETR